MGDVCAVVGGQFGSEGKGLIVGHIAKEYTDHVRVGAANAGHTVYTKYSDEISPEPGWEKHVMQQIPCAAYANPNARLYVGPGALITPEIFLRELGQLNTWRALRGMEPKPVFVDARAQVITREHIEREQLSGLADRIGSTSAVAREGIGAAQAARVMRDESCIPAVEYDWSEAHPHVQIRDVPMALDQWKLFPRLGTVLLEGTQGASLSLTTGIHPYITSRNTTSAGLCADSGVAPNRLDRVILVIRTYPIRVAGPSGPFWHDSHEISWEALGVNPQSERTTVTKKVRRVATFSFDQVEEAAVINGATEVALTFCDYLDPTLKGLEGPLTLGDGEVKRMVDRIQEVTNAPVKYLGTGPHSVVELEEI